MSNIGFVDGCWGQTPPCYWGGESDNEYLAQEVEAAFQKEKDRLLEEAQRELDQEDWAECQENPDYWARQWFAESADGYGFSTEAWEAWHSWF